ncbi:MAG: HEAT repeat domain-containing protein [Myxococcota bacterium]
MRFSAVVAMAVVAVGLLATPAAWALPPAVDPAITTSLGQREDAVGKLAKDPGSTATLIEVLKHDPAAEVRARAAGVLFDRWAAGTDKDAIQDVAQWAAAGAEDDGVRAAAIRALGDVGDDYTLVVPYLDDDSAGVRAAAYSACERWSMRHPDRSAEVRAILDRQAEPDMEGKARLFLEKVRSKMP